MSFTTDLNGFFSSSQWPKTSGTALPDGADPKTYWRASDAACMSASLNDLAAGLDAVMTGTQTIAGAKTFSSPLSASNLTGTNTGDVTVTGTGLTLAGQQLSINQQPYDIPVFYPGNPGDNATLTRVVLSRTVTIPTALSGSVGSVGTNPAATVNLTIKTGSIAIATASISTGGVFTFYRSGSLVLSASTVLSIVNQATHDASLADVSITLTGTRAP